MDSRINIKAEQQCLGYLREDSSQSNLGLFSSYKKQNHESQMKRSQDLSDNDIDDAFQKVSGKRNRPQSQNGSKKKQSYKDKMVSLMNQQELQSKSDYNNGDSSNNTKTKNPLCRQEQLKRNRESAKHSRARRKQYLETLEMRNQMNQKKVEELTIKLKQAEFERDRLKQDNRSFMKTFMSSKNQAYQNLSDILAKSGSKSCDKLSEELQNLIARYGAAGSQRIAATDYYMKQIIQILLSDIHKYIVDCVMNDSGLFGMGAWSKLDDEVCRVLKVTKEARVKLSQNYKMKMIQEFQNFKAVSQKFYDAYRVVQQQAKVIQKIFERITVEFSDSCIAELILWLQQNKFSKQIKKIRADWNQCVQEPTQSSGKCKKKQLF